MTTKVFIDYREYIKSPEWIEKAKEAKKRAGYRCQICNSSDLESTLNAHHRTYDRLGNELPEDITVLCKDCHAKFHDKLPKIDTYNLPSHSFMQLDPSEYNKPVPRLDPKNFTLAIYFQSTDDRTRDNLRMRRVYAMTQTFPGNSILKFILDGKKIVCFGGCDTDCFNPDLLSRLYYLMGTENVKVFPPL